MACDGRGRRFDTAVVCETLDAQYMLCTHILWFLLGMAMRLVDAVRGLRLELLGL